MKNIILSLTLFISINCLAASPGINEIIAYSGRIANQQIFMTLNNKNDTVFGEYFYTRYKTPIPLHGRLADSQISLTEIMTDGDAHIEAKTIEGTITGTWEHKEKTHELHVKALSKSYRTIIENITIADQDNTNKTLRITFKSGIVQSINFETLTQPTSITFEDFTFDGYPDMRILEIEAGGNSSFLYFNYDAASGKYVTSPPEISRVVSPKVFHSENIILSISRDGCCSYLAEKILPKELHSASYNYNSKSGYEIITNKTTGQESRKPITKKHFEANYLNFMGTGRAK